MKNLFWLVKKNLTCSFQRSVIVFTASTNKMFGYGFQIKIFYFNLHSVKWNQLFLFNLRCLVAKIRVMKG